MNVNYFHVSSSKQFLSFWSICSFRNSLFLVLQSHNFLPTKQSTCTPKSSQNSLVWCTMRADAKTLGVAVPTKITPNAQVGVNFSLTAQWLRVSISLWACPSHLYDHFATWCNDKVHGFGLGDGRSQRLRLARALSCETRNHSAELRLEVLAPVRCGQEGPRPQL